MAPMGRRAIAPALTLLMAPVAVAASAPAAPSPPTNPGADVARDETGAEQARRRCGRRAIKVVFRRRGRDAFRCVRIGRPVSEDRGEQRFLKATANTRLWRRGRAKRLRRGTRRRLARFELSVLKKAQRADDTLVELGDRPSTGQKRLRLRAPRGFRLRTARVSRRVRGTLNEGQVERTRIRARIGTRRSARAGAAASGGHEVEVKGEIGGKACPDDRGVVSGEGSVSVSRETWGFLRIRQEVAIVRFRVEARVGSNGRLLPGYHIQYVLDRKGDPGADGATDAEFGKPLSSSSLSTAFEGGVEKADQPAHAQLVYESIQLARASAEKYLKQAEDHFYLAAQCNEIDIEPGTVSLPTLDVLEASIKNLPKPGAEKKHDWNVKLTPKGKVGVSPTKTKSVKGAPVKGKVSKSGSRSRAPDRLRSAEIRAGRTTLGAVEVEGVSPLGRAVASVPVVEEVPDQYFRVTFETSDNFGWNHTYESLVSPGTQAECRTSASGSGSRSASVKAKPGSDQVVVVSGDTVSSNDDMDVAGTFNQGGNFDGTRTGPACSGSFSNPTSGCGTKQVDGSAELSDAGAGRARVFVAGPDPFDKLFDDCPITWPGSRIDAQGNLIEDDVHPFIAVRDLSIALPMDQLNDPSKPVVVVTGSRSNSATQFCSAAGSNNGGACGPEENDRITGNKGYSWKITFTRIPRPF